MKKLFLHCAAIAIMAAFQNNSFAQGFQKTYGGTQDDRAYSVIQTADGGYCVAGNNGSSTSTQYLHVVKFDNSMNVQWTFRINASSPNQTGRSIIQTADGGFVIAGNNNGIGASAGSRDYYILKLDNSGSLLWTRVLDQNGAGNNSLYSIKELPNNTGFICAGTTDASCGTANIALVKLNSDGTYAWKSNLGACNGSGDSWPARVEIANDGGFVVCGTSNSGSNGGGDLYLIKTTSSGSVSWGKRVGGSSYIDQGYALTKSNDGGYAVAGYTKSYPTAHAGVGKNVYVVKFDSGGGLQWTRSAGGTSSSNSGDNIANSIIQTSGDDGYLVAGSTSFYGSGGGIDGYAVKLTSSGSLSWTKTFGGSSTDEIQSVIQNANGDFILAGYSASYGSPTGQFDWYLLTLASDGSACGPNLSSGGYGGTGGGTGTDTNNPTTSINDRGTSGTTSSFTGTTTSMFLVSVSPSATTICNGNSTTLTASGASGYTWSPSTGLNNTTGTSVVASPTTTTTYTVTGTGGINCNPATAIVNVLPTMTVTASNSFTICNGQRTMLLAIGGTSYSWSTGATIQYLNIAPTTTTNYSVTITNVLGCTSQISKTVTVNSNNGLAANITSITPIICPDDLSGVMTVTASGGTTPYTYFWDSTPEQTTVTATGLPSRTYMVNVFDSHGCSAYDIDSIQKPVFSTNDSLQGWIATYPDSLAGSLMTIKADSFIYVAGYTTSATNGKDYLIIKYRTNGEELWAQTYNGPGNSTDEAVALAVDAQGAIYVTGSSIGSGTGKDYATVKYDKDGALKWTARYNGSGNSGDVAQGLVINDTNIVVTGYINQTTTGNNFGTISYGKTAGAQSWLKTYTGTNNSSVDEANSITTSQGYIYVNGRSTGASGRDLVTIKYQTNGDTVWIRRYADELGGNRLYERDPIAVDKNGNVYASGTLNDTLNYALIKYNSSGTFQWVGIYNGPANRDDQVLGLAIDTAGTSIYVTGYAKGSTSDKDYTTIKYNNSGTAQWSQIYNGSGNGTDIATGIALDDSGKVFITGGSLTQCRNLDYVTIKYLPSGTLIWTQHFNSFANDTDFANGIAVNATGDVYITGKSKNTITDFDPVTVKYNPRTFYNIAAMNGGMDLIAKGLLTASKSTTVKNIFYTYMDTAIIDSSHIYYYMTMDELIERADAQNYFLRDTMNKTLNNIYSTTNVDYITSVLNGLPYQEAVLKPNLFIPHLEEFDSGERAENPYIGSGFLEEDYPLNGYSGIDVNVPIEKIIQRTDMHAKPTWLVYPLYPKPPMINGGGGPANILLLECVLKAFNCNACNSPIPNSGITASNYSFGTCGKHLDDEFKIDMGFNGTRGISDGCMDARKWSSVTTPVDNYALVSYVTGFDYWGPKTFNGVGIVKKLTHPIRKYEYHGNTNQVAPSGDGEMLTICNNCNNFDDWDDEQKHGTTNAALGKNGLFQLSRLGQKTVYFILPMTLDMWYDGSPDEAMYFGTQDPTTNPQQTTCGSRQRIEEDYLYQSNYEYFKSNIFGYNTDYLASTNKSAMEAYWKSNSILVGVGVAQGIGGGLLTASAVKTFTAPFINSLPPGLTKIQSLPLNSQGEYNVSISFPPLNPQINQGDILYIKVVAQFQNTTDIINGYQPVIAPANCTGIIVDIHGLIQNFTTPSDIKYLVEIWRQ